MTSFPFPRQLHQIDYLRTIFHLRFQEDFYLTTEMPLRLRRDLQRAEIYSAARVGCEPSPSLLSSPLPEDPVALRRFQKPGPPFVLHPSPDPVGLYPAGSCWRLPVLFFGQGVRHFSAFHDLLEALGELGLHKCAGRFEVVAVEAENASGQAQVIWQEGERRNNLQLPIGTLGYWLELSGGADDTVVFSMQSPARLLSAQRPLFQPTFLRIFPFILRRVTSVLYTFGTLEITDSADLLTAAAQVQERMSTLAWRDWRTLDGGEQRMDLGGVVGSVLLEGESLRDIFWLLKLGTLCNIGKGAGYGAGHYRLEEGDRESCQPASSTI